MKKTIVNWGILSTAKIGWEHVIPAIQKSKKYAQEAEFWQHVGSNMHFVVVPNGLIKTLVTVFVAK